MQSEMMYADIVIANIVAIIEVKMVVCFLFILSSISYRVRVCKFYKLKKGKFGTFSLIRIFKPCNIGKYGIERKSFAVIVQWNSIGMLETLDFRMKTGGPLPVECGHVNGRL